MKKIFLIPRVITFVLSVHLITYVLSCNFSGVQDQQPIILDKTNIVSEGAEDVFGGRVLLHQDFAFPEKIPGSIIYRGLGPYGKEVLVFEPILPKDYELKAEFNTEKIFEAIVDKKFTSAAEVSYMASANANMGAEDKAELLIQDVFRIPGPPRGEAEITKALEAWMAKYMKPDTQYFYCQGLQYSTIQSRVYRKLEAGIVVSGPAFGVNGEYYGLQSKYRLEKVFSVDLVPLTTKKDTAKALSTDLLLKAWPMIYHEPA